MITRNPEELKQQIQKLEELKQQVQNHLGNGFIVAIEKGMTNDIVIVEHQIENRQARAVFHFPPINGRRGLSSGLTNYLVLSIARKFKRQSQSERYTQQVREDAAIAYEAMCRVMDAELRVMAHQS